MKKSIILFFALIISIHVSAQQQYTLTGKVTSVLGDPVAYALVYVKGTTYSTTTNAEGIYLLKLATGKYQIVYQLMGYKQLTEAIAISARNDSHNVQLQGEDHQPAQIETTGEDPAFNIIRKVIEKREAYLTEVKAYQCNVYIRGIQKLLSAPTDMFSREVADQLDIDIKQNSIFYMSETSSQLSYKYPNKYKEIMVSSRVAGNYNAFNFSNAASVQLSFYNNVLGIEGLNQRGFVSPVADNAFKFYTYKLVGSTIKDGKTINKVQVIPIDDRDPVFHGYIYVINGDWRIYGVHLYVTGKSNLNFVDTLNIDQQYVSVGKDMWQPASVALSYSGNVLAFKFNGYILASFSSYNLDPKFPKHFFNGEILRITDQSAKRDSAYWAQNRPVPLTGEEMVNYRIKDSIAIKHDTRAWLDSAEKAKNRIKPIRFIIWGDTIKRRLKREIITINPPHELVQYNTVEGWVADFKPTYTKYYPMGKQYTIAPEFEYGFDNKVLNLNVAFNYDYNPDKQAAVYGKFGADIIDINNAGSVGVFFNGLNSLLYKQNELKLYRTRYVTGGMQHQVARGLLLDGSLEYAERTALQNSSNRTIGKFPDKEFTSNNPFDPSPNAPLLFEQNNALTLKLSATYTIDESYTTTPNGRVYAPSNYPKLKFNYRKGMPILGTTIDYDYVDLEVFHDHIVTTIYGYSAFLVRLGTFLNTNSISYPDLKWFKGNQGLTFRPGIKGFHFLAFYTYSQSAFMEAHYEHNFSGYLLNKVRYVRKLKLDEIVGGNILMQKDKPGYWEIYMGIQRFFLRADYGIVYRGNGKFDQGITLYYGI